MQIDHSARSRRRTTISHKFDRRRAAGSAFRAPPAPAQLRRRAGCDLRLDRSFIRTCAFLGRRPAVPSVRDPIEDSSGIGAAPPKSRVGGNGVGRVPARELFAVERPIIRVRHGVDHLVVEAYRDIVIGVEVAEIGSR